MVRFVRTPCPFGPIAIGASIYFIDSASLQHERINSAIIMKVELVFTDVRTTSSNLTRLQRANLTATRTDTDQRF